MATMEIQRKRAKSPMLAKLDAAVDAVLAADRAWAEDLDSVEAKDAYKAAKAAYKALADEAEAKGVSDDCGRCGGEGGWVGWPGFTCFDCGGTGLGPYKRQKFQAMPPTRAKREREAQARREVAREAEFAQWAQFAERHPEEAAFLGDNFKTYDELPEDDEVGEGYDNFFSGLKQQARRRGDLSEAQLACVRREMDKRTEEANAVEFPAGEHTVEGEIVSLPQTRGYGGSTKTNMLVKLSSHPGNKVMGTISEKVWAAMEGDDEGRNHGSLIGSRVRFSATIKRSDRDDHFGFFKSPKQVEVLYVNREEQG